MAEVVKRRRRPAVVLGVPAIIVAVLAIIALMRIGGPREEPGATGTIGVNASREATLERIEVRQLTSDRTFWAGEIDEPPVFVVAPEKITIEPGAYVSVVGRVEPAPAIDVAAREWRVDEATARAVKEIGTYVRATSVRRAPQP
jgi:hypothetical protein